MTSDAKPTSAGRGGTPPVRTDRRSLDDVIAGAAVALRERGLRVDARSEVGRRDRFTVCFCGHRLHGDLCETCGYATAGWRERRALDELADWKARGHAAHVRLGRKRRARNRRRKDRAR